MDANAHAIDSVELTVVYQPGMRLGQIIEASDPVTPTPWRAKITGIHLAIDNTQIDMRLTLEKPR